MGYHTKAHWYCNVDRVHDHYSDIKCDLEQEPIRHPYLEQGGGKQEVSMGLTAVYLWDGRVENT